MSNQLIFGILGNIYLEDEAVSEYKRMAKVAKSKGDTKSEKLFLHIAEEEAHHKKELQELLKWAENR